MRDIENEDFRGVRQQPGPELGCDAGRFLRRDGLHPQASALGEEDWRGLGGLPAPPRKTRRQAVGEQGRRQ